MSPKAKKNATSRGPRTAGPSTSLDLRKLRAEYELDCSTFARMLGASEASLKRWEEGVEEPREEVAARAARVAKLLAGLARVMRKGFIPTWLVTPNDACKEAGAHTPLDLMERGDYGQIDDMIFYFESGVPT